MLKSLPACLSKYFVMTCFFAFFCQLAFAQTDADALMIPKNFYCAGIIYNHNTWNDYWEGTFKRDNGNIGKLTTNSYALIGNYGITSHLDALFSVPYVTTNASVGTLKGESGLQDLSITLKWLAYSAKIGNDHLNFFAILSGSLPLSNYEPDFDPMSIGLHSRSAAFRGLVNYKFSRFFVTAGGQYIHRDDITIDRTSYYTTELINSNRVYMPDANNLSLTTGYETPKVYVSLMLMQATTLGGFDIRKNDMPFPSNRMNATTGGALFKYSFDSVAGLELTAGGNYVLKGRNVGQSTTIFGGILYLFNFSKKQ
jgi:hypothetical protein